MNLRPKSRGKSVAAFLLSEALIAMAIGGIALAALFAGLSWGMAMIKQTRENERATQLLLSKLELFRLYTWTQLDSSSGYMPSGFTNYFVEGVTNSGTVYIGQVTLTNVGFSTFYTNTMKMVQVSVSWTSGNRTRTRQMQSYYTKDGLQRYIANND